MYTIIINMAYIDYLVYILCIYKYTIIIIIVMTHHDYHRLLNLTQAKLFNSECDIQTVIK